MDEKAMREAVERTQEELRAYHGELKGYWTGLWAPRRTRLPVATPKHPIASYALILAVLALFLASLWGWFMS